MTTVSQPEPGMALTGARLLIRAGFPPGMPIGHAIALIRDTAPVLGGSAQAKSFDPDSPDFEGGHE